MRYNSLKVVPSSTFYRVGDSVSEEATDVIIESIVAYGCEYTSDIEIKYSDGSVLDIVGFPYYGWR